MFTGIIESLGKVISAEKKKGNITFTIRCSFSRELKQGQSVAHNGVCLTVEDISGDHYAVTAVKETLARTNLSKLKPGSQINLERSLKIGDRLDGHFVQGHVDTTAKVISAKKKKGSWLFSFKVQKWLPFRGLLVEKGSVCVNGISLTVMEAREDCFSVAIIPHTFTHTNFSSLKKGDEMNIEFDILGKYIRKILSSK